MKVVALKPGFLNGRRIPAGAELEVSDTFKAAWLAPVTSAAAKAAAPKPAPAKKPVALSQMGKEDSKSFLDVHGEKADLA